MRPRIGRLALLLALGVTRGVLSAVTEPALPEFDHRYHHPHDRPPVPGDRSRTLFPLLKWLRDGTVGLFFGHRKAPPFSYQIPVLPEHADEIVIRFNVTIPDDEDQLQSAVTHLLLDAWSFGHGRVDIRIEKDRVPVLMSVLPKRMHTSYRTLIPDIPKAIADNMHCPLCRVEGEGEEPCPGPDPTQDLFFENFQPLPVVIQWMRLLESMFSSFVRVIRIGRSYEGREILGLRLSVHVPSPNPAKPRKTLVVVAGMHAREWIATTTANYLAWSFVAAFTEGERLTTEFLAEYDMVFVPALNPDGIEFSWREDRLWRKTRQETGVPFCPGMDLDHAFGYRFDPHSQQNLPCSESYGGAAPFEAVEARALADWARDETRGRNARIVAVIDLHSYSQQVLYPYAFSCATDPPNLENLQELAVGLSKALRLANGEHYEAQSACRGATQADGSAGGGGGGGGDGGGGHRSRVEFGGGSLLDWFSHEMRAHFSLQIKLRDQGSYGFLLPREYIKPTGFEAFKAMEYLCDYLLGNNGIERSIGHKHGLSMSRLRKEGYGWGAPGQPRIEDEDADARPDLKRSVRE